MTLEALLDQAWRDLDPLTPITAEDPDNWYVDLSGARGPSPVVQQVARAIRRQPDRPRRVLIMGHAGSGKTTELARLRRELEAAGHRCVTLDALELAFEDLDLVELQVLLVERVGELLRGLGLKLSEPTLRALERWFQVEVRETVEEARGSVAFAPAGLMERLFGELLPGLRAELQVSELRRRSLREQVRRRLREFVDLVSELVGEAHGLLQQNDFRGLVVLVDSLEKAALSPEGLSRTTRILIDQVDQWARLMVPLVITAPLQLLAEGTRIQSHYHETHFISSVPVEARPDHSGQDTPYVTQGRSSLRELVSRRVDLTQIFSAPTDLEDLLTQSGGSIRDLFRLMRVAIDQAPPGQRVGADEVARACKVQRIQMGLQVQPEDVEPLRRLLREPEALHHDAVGVRLLQKELALHYVNGGSWFGVHPGVRARIQP